MNANSKEGNRQLLVIINLLLLDLYPVLSKRNMKLGLSVWHHSLHLRVACLTGILFFDVVCFWKKRRNYCYCLLCIFCTFLLWLFFPVTVVVILDLNFIVTYFDSCLIYDFLIVFYLCTLLFGLTREIFWHRGLGVAFSINNYLTGNNNFIEVSKSLPNIK